MSEAVGNQVGLQELLSLGEALQDCLWKQQNTLSVSIGS